MRRVVDLTAFSFAYFIFGFVGVVTSLGSFLLSLAFRSARAHRAGQQLIHRLFQFFVWYLRRCRLLTLHAEDLKRLRGKRNLILVANHPSLLDAVFVGAYLPNLVCLMKANIVHNVVLCGQSKLAGYVNNKSGVGLIKACQARLAEGSNLLVFPEGTRTRRELGEFKMGFAYLARTVGVPIHTLLIRYDYPFLGKSWPFFHAPPFPFTCRIDLGRSFTLSPDTDVRAFGLEVENYFREELSGQEVPDPVLLNE